MQALDAAVARREEFARVRADTAEQPDAEDSIYWLLTLSAGEHAVRARIAWAREALEVLDRAATDQARPAPEPEPGHRHENGSIDEG